MIRAASANEIGPVWATSRPSGVIRSPTRICGSTKRTSRRVSRPARRACSVVTTSVPTPVRSISRIASATVSLTPIVCGSAMMPCCVRLTAVTSAICGAMSPDLNPRSITPIPPSSASATAIAARVIVSMFADTNGRFSAIWVVNRVLRSMREGSRLGTMPSCGVNRKSSKVQPRTRSSKSTASAMDLSYGQRGRPTGAAARQRLEQQPRHVLLIPSG